MYRESTTLFMLHRCPGFRVRLSMRVRGHGLQQSNRTPFTPMIGESLPLLSVQVLDVDVYLRLYSAYYKVILFTPLSANLCSLFVAHNL